MLRKLKGAIVGEFGSQIRAAGKIGMHPSRLSLIIQQHVAPSPEELKILRKSLGRSVIDSIFAEHSAETVASR
jgi:hypothetical protein